MLPLNHPLTSGLTVDIRVKPDCTLRPDRILTDVNLPKQAWIDGLYIGGENQLLGPIDAYQLSTTFEKKLQADFLTRHKIEHLSDDALQDYLDDYDLSMPTVGRLTLPVITRGNEIRLTGRLAREMPFTVLLGAVIGIDSAHD